MLLAYTKLKLPFPDVRPEIGLHIVDEPSTRGKYCYTLEHDTGGVAPGGAVLRSELMPTDHILALLIEERDKLNRAIEVLGGTGTKRRGRPRKGAVGEVGAAPVATAPVPAKKHHMRSPAARKAQAQRMKLYWAKRKKNASK